MIKNQKPPLMYVVAGVAAVALAFGAYALGNSSSGSGSNGTADASQPGPRNGQAGANGQVPGHDGQAPPRFGTEVTGATADKVKEAALGKYDGTIERIAKLDDVSYVAHVITSDGELHVLVSKDFEVTGVEQGGRRPGAPSRGAPSGVAPEMAPPGSGSQPSAGIAS